MEAIPRNVKMGSVFGFLGGIVAIALMAFYFSPDESALVNMGAYMLIAVMFFALAGGLSRSGQWSWDTLVLMSFVTMGVIGATMVFDAVDLDAGLVLILINVLIIINQMMPSAKTWANRMRF